MKESQTEDQKDQLDEVGHGMKVVLGSIGSSFLIAAVFWAGATYNRVQAIELHLTNIDQAVAKIGDIQAIAERTADTQRRLEKLEDAERKRR